MSPRPILIAFAFTLLAAPLAAQLPESSKMASGVWRGWIVRQDEDSLRVTWLVEQTSKGILIVLRSPDNPEYGMGDVKLKNDVLNFTWAMGQGSFLVCRLSRRGSPAFDGICQDARLDSQGGRTKLFVNMTPPRTGGRGTRPDSTFP